MSRQQPFEGVSVLVIDGNNLLHRTAGGLGGGQSGGRGPGGRGPGGRGPGGLGPGGLGPSAVRVLIPRLRAVLPAGVRVSLILDGMPDPGGPGREHIGSITIAHAGRRSADDAIVEAVEHSPYEERPRTIVVTDDRALADRVKRLGALHRRVSWLQDVLELAHRGPRGSSAGARAAGSPIGRPGVRPSHPTPGAELVRGGTADELERIPWTPGRGATKKRGNPMRHRSSRSRDR